MSSCTSIIVTRINDSDIGFVISVARPCHRLGTVTLSQCGEVVVVVGPIQDIGEG
jgi:hypothetical protein